MKINNQLFIKSKLDKPENICTIKCSCCNESSSILKKDYPIGIKTTDYVNWTKNFTKLHTQKGCNKVKVKEPEWAATEISFGLTI